jgi:hypothetical protein
MIIDIPNVGQVNFPDSMSEGEVNAAAKKLFDESSAAAKPENSGVISSLKRGAEQLASSGQTAYESITKGGEEAAMRAQERQSDIQRRLGEGASLERLQDVYKQQGLLAAAKELGGQIPSALAEQASNIGATIAGGLTGAAAGSLAGPVGTVVGGITGAFAPSFVQQYGGNIQRQAAAQQAEGKPLDISRTAAAGTAVPQAALDVVGTLIPLGGNIVSKILGPSVGKLIGGGGSKLAEETLLATVLKGTATGVLAEIPTEVTQQMLERAQAGLALTNDEALKEYGETAFAVSLLGPIGILGRVSNKAQAGRDLAAAQALAAQTNEPQQVDISVADAPEPQTMYVSPTGDVADSLEKLQEAMQFKQYYEAQNAPAPAVKPPEVLYGSATGNIGTSVNEVQQVEQFQRQALDRQAELKRVVTPEAIQGLGIGRTASIFKDPTIINQSLSDPKVADATRAKLLSIQKAHSSDETKQKISNFLNRPEFITPKYVDELLNPATEMTRREATALNKQQFAFIGPKGDIQVKYGDIVQKDGKQYAKYDTGGGRNITDEVMVNPSPAMMESWLLSKEQDKANKIPDDFKEYLAKRKISTSEMSDLNMSDIPKSKKGSGIYKTYFSGQGSSIDELVNDAISNGLLNEDDVLNHGKDAVDGMRELIREALVNDARIPYTPQNNEALNRTFDISRRRDQIEAMLDQPTTMVTKEQPAEPIDVGMQEVSPEEKAAIEAEASIKAAESFEGTPAIEPPPTVRAEAATPYSDKFIADGKKMAKNFRKALDRMGLKNVGLKFEEQIIRTLEGKSDEISGDYFQNLIRVSMSSSDPIRTLNHEALHAMKDLGMFSDKEWSILEKQAKAEWLQKYNIAENYGKESQEIQIEEAIAHAFADYQKQKPFIKAIANKVRQFLGALRNAIMNTGARTVDDVFARAAAGKLKPTTAPTSTVSRAEVPSRKKFKAPMQGVDPAYAEKLRQAFTQEQATVKQKMDGLRENFFERMVTGLFDEFRAIKKYDPTAYMMARLSKSIDGGLQGLLEHGHLSVRDGALDIKANTKGLLEILEPVGAEVDQYQSWKALSRDANLPADKRSLPADLVAGRDQLIQGNLNGKPRKAIYEQALREENELNKSVLKIAKDLGLIDQAGYDKFASDIYYIPFYKMMEEGDVQSVSAAAKLTGQQFSKTLKGGEKKLNDLMENVLMNWSHILSAAMKNQAAVKTIDAAVKMGAATEVKPMDGKYPKGSVKVMKDGKPVHYELSDPDLVDAISTISYLGPKSQFLDIARGFTNALRYGITMSPAYKVRNLIRDSIQSAAISELGPNMFSNVYNGLAMSKDGNPTFMSALAGGGIFEMGTAHEGNQAKLIKRLVDKGVNANQILDTTDKIKGKLGDLLNWYNEQGNKFENANRLALYQKLIDSGKTHLEASYAARDLMDFSMQGQFRAVKIIGSVVPFFNARLQGLYKLGRDGVAPTYRVISNATTGAELKIGDKQKAMRFATISSAVMLASLALYDMYKDDEDFKRREDWDRDNFWWFKIGDTAYRIPKPFEIGALGTIAERTYEQIADENVEGKVFADRLNHILMDTFSLNPTPQMVKPLIDLYANKDSFTGAPIESGGMENLSKQERINSKTSGLAIALGGVSEGAAKILTFNPQAQGFSPIQMDYAIKAYFGWLGATAASTADLAVEPFQEGTKVRPPIIDTVAMGFIKTEPQTQSKYMTQFYQNNVNLQSALADMRHYAELGDSEKVQKIYEERGQDIALAKVYDKTSKQFSELRKQSRLIENNPNIPADEKRAEMNRLRILMSDMAEQVESMRKQLKK